VLSRIGHGARFFSGGRAASSSTFRVTSFNKVRFTSIAAGLDRLNVIDDYSRKEQRRRCAVELVMRCMFTHQWTINLQSRLAYRTCRHCGITQRGNYIGLFQDIAWETLRERALVKPQEMQFVRRGSTQLDQIAHSLRLRRTRASDKAGLRNGPNR